jgi:hypothetical protein
MRLTWKHGTVPDTRQNFTCRASASRWYRFNKAIEPAERTSRTATSSDAEVGIGFESALQLRRDRVE